MSRLSSKVTRALVPLSNLPERTVWVDDTVLNVTESTSLNFVPDNVRGRCLKDSAGKYVFEFIISGSKDSSSGPINLSMTGISASYNQVITVNQANGTSNAMFYSVTDEINTGGHTAANTTEMISGTIVLDTRPSWFDANKEAGFSIAAQVEDATATTTGLVNPTGGSSSQQVFGGTYTPVLSNVNMDTLGTANTFYFTRIGPIVTVAGQISGQVAGAAGDQFTMSLPIDPDSNFSGEFNLSGSGSGNGSNDGNQFSAVANSGTVLAKVNYRASTASGTVTVAYNFMYRLS